MSLQPKFELSYSKQKKLDLEILKESYTNTEKIDYNPFEISNLQNYNPLYKIFFTMNENNYENISMKHRFLLDDLYTVIDTNTGKKITGKNVFIKFSPLLDPLKYMIGKYDLTDPKLTTLPKLNNEDMCHKKLTTTNNASYVDCFFSYLSSNVLHKHGFIHGIDFYGTYLGIQKKFKINISDDYDYLNNSKFFHENIDKYFTIINKPVDDNTLNNNSRANKNKIIICDNTDDLPDILIEDICDLDFNNTIVINEENIKKHDEINDDSLVYIKKSRSSSDSYSSSKTSQSSSTNNSISINDSDSQDSEIDDSVSDEESDDYSSEDSNNSDDSNDSNNSSDDSEEIQNNIVAFIDNFPIQMICLENCDGTLDQLFENEEIDMDNACSAMFQIIATLQAYQQMFHFTHNDLHTNNIMYKNTDIEFIYYIIKGKTYKVPTFGRIYKIIDFGRSIYQFKGKLFCSDSFANGGDAATQYNFEPYYNKKKPIIMPNYGFDLCRLGCSIFDFIMDYDDDYNNLDDFQKTIYDWCKDDNDKNVLYKSNGDERYHNFKLYKMIARTCHLNIPEYQYKNPIFSQYLIDKCPENGNEIIMNIDTLPNYTIA